MSHYEHQEKKIINNGMEKYTTTPKVTRVILKSNEKNKKQKNTKTKGKKEMVGKTNKEYKRRNNKYLKTNKL